MPGWRWRLPGHARFRIRRCVLASGRSASWRALPRSSSIAGRVGRAMSGQGRCVERCQACVRRWASGRRAKRPWGAVGPALSRNWGRRVLGGLIRRTASVGQRRRAVRGALQARAEVGFESLDMDGCRLACGETPVWRFACRNRVRSTLAVPRKGPLRPGLLGKARAIWLDILLSQSPIVICLAAFYIRRPHVPGPVHPVRSAPPRSRDTAHVRSPRQTAARPQCAPCRAFDVRYTPRPRGPATLVARDALAGSSSPGGWREAFQTRASARHRRPGRGLAPGPLAGPPCRWSVSHGLGAGGDPWLG